MNIKIKKHLLLYKGYKLKCSIGKSGITSSKKEGDLVTPKGIFKLGPLYYRNDRINLKKCRIKRKIIKKGMRWCNDSRSKKYNKEINYLSKYRSEKLYRNDKIYDLYINIQYNFSPVIKELFLNLNLDNRDIIFFSKSKILIGLFNLSINLPNNLFCIIEDSEIIISGNSILFNFS